MRCIRFFIWGFNEPPNKTFMVTDLTMEMREFLKVSDDDDGGDHDDDVGGDEDDDVGVEDVLHLGCNSHSFVEGILG